MHSWRSNSANRHTGLLNLTLAAAVCLLAWFSWWVLQDKPASVAQQRSFEQVTATWECDQGHRYHAPGGFGPQPCPTCGADAFIVARYHCAEHGEIPARLRHEQDEEGNPVVSGICFADGEWILHPQKLLCPYCDRELEHVRQDPFAILEERGR